MYNLILSNMIAFFLLTYLGYSLLNCRITHFYAMMFICILSSLCAACFTSQSISLYASIILTILYLLYLILMFQGAYKRIFLIFLYFITISAVAEIIAANLINLLFTLGPKDINTIKYTSAVIFSGLISLTLSQLFINMLNYYDLKDLPAYTYLIFILPLTTMALILNMSAYFELLKSHTVLIFILLGLLLSNYITISVFLKFAASMRTEKELWKIKKENEVSNAKYELLNTQFQTSYHFLHDTVHSLMILINSESESDQLKKQIYHLNTKLVKELNIIHTNSSIVSPILNYRVSKFMEYDIDVKTVLEYNDFTFMDAYTQREIFSALLDIAIDQCSQASKENRLVILKTKKIHHQIIIQQIFTHGEFSDHTRARYTSLEAAAAQSNGIVSYHPCFLDTLHDSIILVFQ